MGIKWRVPWVYFLVGRYFIIIIHHMFIHISLWLIVKIKEYFNVYIWKKCFLFIFTPIKMTIEKFIALNGSLFFFNIKFKAYICLAFLLRVYLFNICKIFTKFFFYFIRDFLILLSLYIFFYYYFEQIWTIFLLDYKWS